MSRELDSYNQRVIEAFRANGGVVEPGLDLLLLHHVGARSGRERVTPLAYWRVESTLAIFAPVFSGLQPPLPVPNWG